MRIKFHDLSWLFHQSQKKTVVVKRLHWPLGTRYSGRCRCRAGFKQESMYGLSAATKKKSRCGEVAVSGGSTVEMLFFNFILGLTHWGFSEFFFFPLDDQTSAPEVFSSCSFNPGAYFETRWSITMVTRYDVTSSRWSTRENEVPHSPLVVKSFLSDNASFFNFFLL